MQIDKDLWTWCDRIVRALTALSKWNYWIHEQDVSLQNAVCSFLILKSWLRIVIISETLSEDKQSTLESSWTESRYYYLVPSAAVNTAGYD